MPSPNRPRRMSNNSNLGKGLELLLDMTNRQYKNMHRADVRKVPTPVQITKSLGGDRVQGRKLKAEWVDYVGVGAGKALAFEAKQTKVKTSFPLANIAPHQVEFLESWHSYGATTFIIVEFASYFQEIYLLTFEQLQPFWEASLTGGAKSIKYEYFQENCKLIKSYRGITLDYLRALEGDET